MQLTDIQVSSGGIRNLFSTLINVGPLEKTAIALFIATSFQAAFLTPYVIVVHGERANLFTGLLCAISLIAALIARDKNGKFFTNAEIAVAAILTILAAVSGLLSITPQASLFRGFVVVSSGLGGFVCARILLRTTDRKFLFAWFCTILVCGILLVSLIGRVFLADNVFQLLDANPHPLANRLFILFFGPLALLLAGQPGSVAIFLTLLLGAYVFFYLSHLRSGYVIPILLATGAFVFGKMKLRHFVWLLVPLIVVGIFFVRGLDKAKFDPKDEPTYYRAENYPFSWHIASQHPWFGIGLRAPRDAYLENYSLKYPYVDKERFSDSVRRVVNSENIFLTFMAELGFPFVVLYCLGIGYLLLQLVKQARLPVPAGSLNPLALLLPIGAGLLHFLVLDGLLHPQISWFFHVLLGMIPTEKISRSK
ncbi:O-antigen ligase family protein [Desulfomonile tiedjei]|uniref:O-Antigen ligase n=1 Tax=Desulfomonile tiedjei (strain ATCC 49306 / DSM 6799 / DCB-1) TaxID=706587 RepID=I4CAJ8_DESTA|nr:O-antigen ligase family protein [Desulfomonile tiedjei]AFM26589.1 O-Antigen ligase [Desulfomonile tiedjei DSM 6799]